jgi:hypothetical protein
MSHPSDNTLTWLGRTTFRSSDRPFGIRQQDRLAHTYVIGKTGTGKSTLLETMIRQDVHGGRGLALLDPHGDLAAKVRAAVPQEREANLIYLDAADTDLAFNPLERVAPARRALVASLVLGVFKKIWSDFWGPRMEHILRNALLTLLDQPQATLADILRLLDNVPYRRQAVALVRNPQVREFWLREYEQYPWRLRAEAIAPIQNKVGAFVTHPVLNKILVQPRSNIHLRRFMDEGKIFVVNLSAGRIGEDAATLLGALLVATMGAIGLGRADVPEGERRNFFIYLDEFHLFTTQSLANMLAELRKYHLGLVLAHQYLGQLDPGIQGAILGNVGTTICFRVGAPDADEFAKDFSPQVAAHDLTALPNHHVYLRLMADGVLSPPFSAATIAPVELTGHSQAGPPKAS